MDTYYDILKVEPTASVPEIEAAFELQYNQWRRLVTHHDPNVVTQANQALMTLEQVRTTLTDPTKRSAYDAGLRLGGAVGGITDPTAVLRDAATPTFRPTPPKATRAVQPASVQRVDAWICPKCQTANPVQTRFCRKCGHQIGNDCPNCGEMVEAVAEFCQACGVNIKEAIEQKEEEEKYRLMHEAEQRRREAERLAILGPVAKLSEEAWNITKLGCIIGVFLSIVGLPFWIIGMVKARKALGFGQVPGDTEYRDKAKKAFWYALIPTALFGLAILCYGLIFALSIFGSIFSTLSGSQ